MQYLLFDIDTEIRDESIRGAAFLVTKTDCIYQFIADRLQISNKESYMEIAEKLFDLIGVELPEECLALGKESEEGLYICIFPNNILPEPAIYFLANAVVADKNKENWVDFECSECEKTVYCYKLPKLSILYSLPLRDGKVICDKKGAFFLLSSDVLFDFLDQAKEPIYSEPVLDDVTKLFMANEMEEERES